MTATGGDDDDDDDVVNVLNEVISRCKLDEKF